MTIACALLQQHIQTLVDDNAQWQKLIADDIVWELTYAPSLGHPARLSGREEAVRHATWFVGAVENFRFFDLAVHALWCSCVLHVARSRSCGNISIPCERPRRWTHRFSVSSDLLKMLR